MSPGEQAKGFLGRWSERKRRSRLPVDATAEVAVPMEETPPLPPLESLDADSDYTAFLRAGVGHGLRASALRRAWATDPAIASFRGMAEYDWDFNVPGYGWLRPTDDVTALARRVFGEQTEAPAPAPPAEDRTPPTVLADEAESAAPADPPPPPAIEPPVEAVTAAVAPELLPAAVPARRHGGALPR